MFLVIEWMRGCQLNKTLIYKIYFQECVSNKLNGHIEKKALALGFGTFGA